MFLQKRVVALPQKKEFYRWSRGYRTILCLGVAAVFYRWELLSVGSYLQDVITLNTWTQNRAPNSTPYPLRRVDIDRLDRAIQAQLAHSLNHLPVDVTCDTQDPALPGDFKTVDSVLDLKSRSMAVCNHTQLVNHLLKVITTHFGTRQDFGFPRYLIVKIDPLDDVSVIADRLLNEIAITPGTPFAVHSEIIDRQSYPPSTGLEAANQFREDAVWGLERAILWGDYPGATRSLNLLQSKYPDIDLSDISDYISVHTVQNPTGNPSFSNREYPELWSRIWGETLKEAMTKTPLIIVVSNSFNTGLLNAALSKPDWVSRHDDVTVSARLKIPGYLGFLPAILWGQHDREIDCQQVASDTGIYLSYSPSQQAQFVDFMAELPEESERYWDHFVKEMALVSVPDNPLKKINPGKQTTGDDAMAIGLALAKIGMTDASDRFRPGANITERYKQYCITQLKDAFGVDYSVPLGMRIFSRVDYPDVESTSSLNYDQFVFASYVRFSNALIAQKLPHVRWVPEFIFQNGNYFFHLHLVNVDQYPHYYQSFFNTPTIASPESMLYQNLSDHDPNRNAAVGLGFGIPYFIATTFVSGETSTEIVRLSNSIYFRLPDNRSSIDMALVRKYAVCARFVFNTVHEETHRAIEMKN